MVWNTATIKIGMIVEVRVIDVLADEDIIAVGAIVMFVKFAVIVSRSVGVSSEVSVNFFVDVLTDLMPGILPDISIEVLTDVNKNACAVVITVLEFPVSTPPEELNRCAEFDCRPRAPLDCDRVLHTRMPSYHV